ncbi:Predicted ATPase [Prauserella marina]|uniref:Predicted ATPase n=1 Tax=Prauserella marina TaxID=530584 RepID=A0A1G6KJ11_9PSEU|nr:AAA family ATPase [Prauserella marina]PWV84084.1 putative ATPase [Prauserella marina]SDC30781.1 Predicted ATPase [Prauserella marina]
MRTQDTGGALIGREHPAALLRAEITRATESHGGLVLVTGEAGIGKTTLVTGTAEEARALGALVVGGACWDSEAAPGYWPWVQVFRGLRRAATDQEWAAAREAAGDGLGVLLGEAGAEVPDTFALYDSVTSALVAVSAHRPVLVVLDDVHWADTASLTLLEFVARHTWFERLLLVGTYRDVEVEAAEHVLRPRITALVAAATTITLTGLDVEGVTALMERTTGAVPDPALVAEVHRRTGGNPFFVEQTARLWHSDGSVAAVPPGVRDAVRRRISLLPAPVSRMLTDAAVLGGVFHRQVLAAMGADPVAKVDRLLERAMAARLVVAKGNGAFAFAHDLVRETLRDELGEGELRSRHAAVVTAVGSAPSLAERVFKGDLARHAVRAGDEIAAEKTTELLLAAGRDAAIRMAFDEAIGHFRTGAALAKRHFPRRYILIMGELAQELLTIERTEEGVAVVGEAAAYARAHDDPVLLGSIALSTHIADHGRRRELSRALLSEAHPLLTGSDEDEVADRPLNQLAIEVAVRLQSLARETGDDEGLALSLFAQHNMSWGTGNAEDRLAMVDELAAVARRTGDTESEQYAVSLRWVALLERGDPAYQGQMARFAEMIERSGDTRMWLASVVDRCIVAAFTGRFAEAETLLLEAERFVEQQDRTHIDTAARHLRWLLAYQRGRLDELDAMAGTLIEGAIHRPRLLRAMNELAKGETAFALRYLRDVCERGEGQSIMDMGLWLRFQAQLAAATGDPELCERARKALLPHAGTYLVSMFGFDISGPVTYWLGRLDAAQQRWDEAVGRFAAAKRSAERMGSRPWAAEAGAGLAKALAARGNDGDDVRADKLRAEVAAEAAELGMRHLLPAGDTPGEADHAAADTTNEFRFTGDVWSLSMAGDTVLMPDSKGLRDVHTLLRQPGTDIPAVALLDPAGGDVVVAAKRLGGDPVLDDEAKARYQRRLTALDEEIEAAIASGADAKAAGLDRERDALLRELRTAAGLGGRTRRLGDEAERARKTVSARIRDTLRKLDDRHPALATHLRAAVSTGANCRYTPESGVRWRL